MGIPFYKSGELIATSHVKIPLKSSAILNIKNDDKYCFLWSKLDKLRPISHSMNGHATRVSNYRQKFDELNNEGFDFSKGFKCGDMHCFEKLNNLSINNYELNFYRDQNKWKQKLIPNEINKIKSDRVFDFLIYKIHDNVFKKLNVFLGEQGCRYICKQLLKSSTSENMTIKHKQQCDQKEITGIRTSNGSQLHSKKHFQKKPFFRIYADSKADSEIDICSIGNITTNVYKQNPVYNGIE